MKKGYHPLIAGDLDLILRAFKQTDFLIAIEHWLIQEVQTQLKDKLEPMIRIEVIKFGLGPTFGAYPALAIHCLEDVDRPDLEPLIESTIKRVLGEKPIMELITFIGTSGTDWNRVGKQIMEI